MFDIIIEKVISSILSNNLDKLINAARNSVSNYNESELNIKEMYSKYIKTIYEKYSSSKTLIYHDSPRPLSDFYEPLDLYNDDSKMDSPTIKDLIQLERSILITGTGGCGKSTIMKSFLINAISLQTHIPIFIELRNLEKFDGTLMDFVLHSLNYIEFNIQKLFLHESMVKGEYIYFFDGLDELSHDRMNIRGCPHELQ